MFLATDCSTRPDNNMDVQHLQAVHRSAAGNCSRSARLDSTPLHTCCLLAGRFTLSCSDLSLLQAREAPPRYMLLQHSVPHRALLFCGSGPCAPVPQMRQLPGPLDGQRIGCLSRPHHISDFLLPAVSSSASQILVVFTSVKHLASCSSIALGKHLL